MATITDLDKSSSTAHLSKTSALPEYRDADRSVDSPSPPVTSTGGQDGKTSPSSPDNSSTQSAEYWASLIRQSFSALYNGGTLEAECLKAPRRRHAGTYNPESHQTGSVGKLLLSLLPCRNLSSPKGVC